MSTVSIEQTGRSLIEELNAARSSAGDSFSARLTGFVLEKLSEEEHADDPTPFCFERRDAYSDEVIHRFDGYDLHPNDDARFAIDLYVTLSFEDEPARVVTPLEANQAFRQVRSFVEQALRHKLHEEPDVESEVADVSRALLNSGDLATVRLVLITNGLVKEYDRASNDKLAGIQLARRAVDLRVIERLWHPDKVQVDFASDQAKGLRCVPLPQPNGTYRSYLTVVPGQFLAELYKKHAQRLLEANVRSYLKATSKVNKEILKTIRDQPEMFFAYNNGITATAKELTVEETADGPVIVSCSDLQIVNGGQTTASLFEASQRKVSLEKVFVPMKINEVRDEGSFDVVVQRISLCANSQSKINLSDLGANLPFHRNLELLARQERCPVIRSAQKQATWWFYERMRGQYANELARMSGKDKKEWEAQHPRSQVLSKTDIARYVMAWEQEPHRVCAGGEKCFRRFSDWLRSKGWLDPGSKAPEAQWFHELIAKGLLFEHAYKRTVEAKITGHRPNIAAYVVSWLASQQDSSIDLDAIWKKHAIPEDVDAWIVAAIAVVHEHIQKTPNAGDNVGEWTKKEACWKGLLERPFVQPRSSRKAK